MSDDESELLHPDRDRPGAFTIRVGGASQSYVDPSDPRHLEFEYVQRMADVIDLWAPEGERQRVLHVGGAGMTMARYIAATRPTSPQIVLEPDADLTTQVRRELPLPRRSGIKVRDTDGRTGVGAMADDWADMIISDAFAGGKVPAELGTSDYFAELARVLRPTGVVLVNVTDRGPFGYSRRVVAGLLDHFSKVAITSEPPILKSRRFGNLVLIAANTGLPIGPLHGAGARATFQYRVISDADLQRWVSGAVPFTDANAEPSPDLVTWIKSR